MTTFLNDLFQEDFNIQDTDLQGFEKMPKGLYPFVVVSHKMIEKPENGTIRINYECQVTDGPAINRKFFPSFCIQSPNQQVADIGKKDFKKFAVACDNRNVQAIEDLYGAAGVVDVSYRKDKNDPEKEWEQFNFLTATGKPFVYSGQEMQQVPTNQQAQQMSTQGGQFTPEWAR